MGLRSHPQSPTVQGLSDPLEGDNAQLGQGIEAGLDGFLFAAGVLKLGLHLGQRPFPALGASRCLSFRQNRTAEKGCSLVGLSSDL